MWIAFVIVSAFLGVALIWWSVALGFTFFVLPVVVCELALFGAGYLLRQAWAPEDDSRERPREWRMEHRDPLPGLSRQDHGRASDAGRARERVGGPAGVATARFGAP